MILHWYFNSKKSEDFVGRGPLRGFGSWILLWSQLGVRQYNLMKACLVVFMFVLSSGYVGASEMIHLWPDGVPGETESKASPVISDDHTGDVIRIEKVTNPALIVFEANPDLRNGGTVIICPGGGYHHLAVDKEGYEIAEWLSSLGYTTFVLQYRVPENRDGAFQDTQRAIRCVRGMAERWGIESDKIGILGFSAGGSLGARVSTGDMKEAYLPVDENDHLSARPDFCILIYPAYLDLGPDHSLTPELELNEKTPPMFLFAALDDQKHVNSSLVMGSGLREANVPFELHVLPEGGHGFGMRPGNRAAEMWPKLCEAWMALTVLE